MYERYPTSASPQNPAGMQPPRSVLNAVKLMYVGAGLSAIVVIVTLATIGGLRAAILAKYPHYSSSQVHTAEVGFIATDVLSGLVAVGLWLWMAWANRRGRNWARIVSAVFFGINTLNLFGSFVQVHDIGTVIVAVAVWLVGAGAIMLLFNRESTPYFQQPKLL
ncbi:MAG TPA: hypothetical protein VKS82_02770 [Streptosporangiaceae bacterium]|nr:hypothetical protein [Streptosporangiaceae bacterium]